MGGCVGSEGGKRNLHDDFCDARAPTTGALLQDANNVTVKNTSTTPGQQRTVCDGLPGT